MQAAIRLLEVRADRKRVERVPQRETTAASKPYIETDVSAVVQPMLGLFEVGIR